MLEEPELTDRQRRVLDAAMEVFAERGFHGTSTAEIAKRAGVAEGTVFKTYKTKKELLIAVVAPFFARTIAPSMIDDVRRIINTDYDHFDEFLRALWTDRIHFIRAHQRVVRIALQELPFHDEVRELAKKTLGARVMPDVLAMIRRYQERGELRIDDPLRILRLIVGTFASYMLTVVLLAPERAWDDDAEVEVMVQVLSKGLRP